MGLMVKRILCTTDFSDLSVEGLEYSIDLARHFEAELRILHVYALPTYFAAPEGAFIPSADYATTRSNEVQEQLDALVAQYSDRGVPLKTALKVGVSYKEIVADADAWNADLIVMASHGHSGITHVILGSVTERVLRTASCPVLVVRKGNTYPSDK